ncbi:MAG: preprotein translocase subunit SecA [Dehalococcoidia bacterium]|nr:preprotein translocase subunit SecA [Dehalococcoidia bacterium]
MVGIFRKIFGGDTNDRVLQETQPLVDAVLAYDDEVQALSEADLRAKTDEFRARLADGETLDELLPEAFAVAREAIARSSGERAYPMQLLGAVALHRGSIAEMRTGEGKTLVATLALYLNALEGEGAHLVTVNDYLARRDAQWYGPALDTLGLTLGVLQHDSGYRYSREPASQQSTFEHLVQVPRREAYTADVTYGTNNEFGFDYLRDNMATSLERRVQVTGRHFAIVDEADSVLIDEARTPLIISGPAPDDVSVYPRFARLVPSLEQDRHYVVDLKTRTVNLTEQGIEALERGLGVSNIYSPENFRLTRYMEAALRAQIVYQRDRDYVVKDGQVVIVDDFTGRLMEGRRWSDGLHQAVEAKEGVQIQQESVTYATITLQNFFRLYEKLSGMTGTALTEAQEFSEIYELEVVVIPTHRSIAREDLPDLVFRNEPSKWRHVIEDIVEKHEAGRPVLVGTVAIETSEALSDLLRRRGIEHEVLNAKQHQREAQIIARAGERGAVTIATNMAGRGTDIKLGSGVADIGGLHVLGTERHEARRIDNQLRGRSGRQGDPGSTRFFVSFEDSIMKRFAPDWLPGMMERLGMEEDTPLESKMVTRAIEQAQQKVENYNFDIRKHVVDYDNVMNTHRDVIYTERDKVLSGESLRETVLTMLDEEVDALADSHLRAEPRDAATFRASLDAVVSLGTALPAEDIEDDEVEDTVDAAIALVDERYAALEAEVGDENQRLVERLVMLRTIDSLWVEHLTAMDEMRQGIGLRAYGQTDPLVAYKRESHDMWDQLRERIRQLLARQILNARLQPAVARQMIGQDTAPQTRESGPGEPGNTVASGNGASAPPPPASASRAERRRFERQQQKAQKRAKRRG